MSFLKLFVTLKLFHFTAKYFQVNKKYSKVFLLLGDVVGGGAIGGRQISLVELPAEIIVKILQYMSYKEVSAVRRVTRRLNELCAARLNTTFQRLQSQMLVRFQAIKVGKGKKL